MSSRISPAANTGRNPIYLCKFTMNASRRFNSSAFGLKVIDDKFPEKL
jgi:hypothetical protein